MLVIDDPTPYTYEMYLPCVVEVNPDGTITTTVDHSKHYVHIETFRRERERPLIKCELLTADHVVPKNYLSILS